MQTPDLKPTSSLKPTVPAVETGDRPWSGPVSEPPSRWRAWLTGWNQLVAVIALVNLLLGLFNLSYVPLRDVYLQHFPAAVVVYDPVKGIEPHPNTQAYLQQVNRLEAEVPTLGLRSPQIGALLADLRQQSDDLIDENPFAIGNKFGTFAKFKRRIQDQVQAESATRSLQKFWDANYLETVGWAEAIAFFDNKLRPLLETTYFRTVGETGQYSDRFWQLDLYFLGFFAVELLGRTFFFSRRQPGISWADALLRRWYDWFLLIPVWRWLRIIPVAVRLHQSNLVNMERILAQVTYEPAAYLADRVSGFLMVRLVNQTKDAVEQGEAARLLFQSGQYIRVSNVNKVDAITNRLLELTIYRVLPEVQPELKALLQHSLEEAFKQFEFYEQLQALPGFAALPTEATEQLAGYLARTTGDVLASTYADAEGRELLDRLTQDIKRTLARELQDAATQSELQTLIADLLEELKINYVQSSAQYNAEDTLAEVDHLNQVAEQKRE